MIMYGVVELWSCGVVELWSCGVVEFGVFMDVLYYTILVEKQNQFYSIDSFYRKYSIFIAI